MVERVQVGGLPPVVELVEQGAPELGDHVGEPVAPARLGVAVDERGDLFDDVHVLDDLSLDVRALDLDGDLPAAAEDGVVHLAQGCRGDRCRGELLERFGHPHPEFAGDDGLDLLERERLHVVLQARQGSEIDGRQQVGAGREQLAQLDERRAHALELGGEGVGVLERRRVVGAGGVEVDGAADEVDALALEEEADDVLVAGQVRRLQGDSHEGPMPPGGHGHA